MPPWLTESMVSLSSRRRRRGRPLHLFPQGHRLPDCTSALLDQRITVAQQRHSGAGFCGLVLGECAGGKAFSRRKFGALSWHLELCQCWGCSEQESDSNDHQSHHYSEVLVDSGRGRLFGPRFALSSIRLLLSTSTPPEELCLGIEWAALSISISESWAKPRLFGPYPGLTATLGASVDCLVGCGEITCVVGGAAAPVANGI